MFSGFFPLFSPFCYWTHPMTSECIFFSYKMCFLKNSFYFLLTIPSFSFISNVFFFNFREPSNDSYFRVSVRIIPTFGSSQGCLSLENWFYQLTNYLINQVILEFILALWMLCCVVGYCYNILENTDAFVIAGFVTDLLCSFMFRL